MHEVLLDTERQKRAKRYARIRRRLSLLDMLIGAAYVVAWLAFGWTFAVKALIVSVTTNPFLVVAAYAAIFGGAYLLISLSLGYYTSFVLPHRFGQSNQTLRGWVTDQLKGLLFGGVLGLLLLQVIYALLRAAPDTWWLWVAGFLLVFSVLMANLGPVLLMPLFNKFVPLGEEHADLAARLHRLAEKAGTRLQGVYRFDMSRRTKAANAALTGLGNTRRVILGDTLLEEFSPDEIETVLAHELGHHVNRDIPLLIAAQSVLTLVGLFLASLGLRWGVSAFGFDGPADIAAFPLFAIIMGAYGLVTMPLENALSRWRERLADRYALEATGKPQAFIAAMTRLANQNLAEVDPEPWVEWLLYSHPALSKRIRMAQDYAKAA